MQFRGIRLPLRSKQESSRIILTKTLQFSNKSPFANTNLTKNTEI